MEFALRCFEAIDTDRSGALDRQEMYVYLERLGYGVEEADLLIARADINQDGSIDFSEFCGGFGASI